MLMFLYNAGKEPLQDDLRLCDCYCLAYKAILMQGWNNTPQSYQNRIAFVYVMIAGMLLYWHWEAMLISYLAVKKVVIPYKSFEQLLSSSNDKVHFYNNLYKYRHVTYYYDYWHDGMT